MKKVMQTLAVVATLLSPLALGGTALAASTCQVGYTGPNSNNLCVATTTYLCDAVNSTTVNFAGENTQIALTGDSSSSTGSATNSNGVALAVTATNGSCTLTATVPATTVTPTATPVTPTPTVSTPQKVTATTLPNTASRSPLTTAAIAVGTLGAGAVLVRLVANAYVHIKS